LQNCRSRAGAIAPISRPKRDYEPDIRWNTGVIRPDARQHIGARGAAKGAAAGALIGAVAGDAGKGAAIGATTGGIAGGRRSRKQKEQQQAQVQDATAKQQSAMATYQRAYTACLEGRGYTVK